MSEKDGENILDNFSLISYSYGEIFRSIVFFLLREKEEEKSSL